VAVVTVVTGSDDDGSTDTRGTQDDGGQLFRIHCGLDTAVALYIFQARI